MRNSRHFLAILVVLTASTCLAADGLPLPRNAETQTTRRTHYIVPPLPPPHIAITQPPIAQQLTVPLTKGSPPTNPAEIRLAFGQDLRTAWSLDDAIAATLTADPMLRIGRADIDVARAELLTSSLIPNPTLEIAGDSMPIRGSGTEAEFTIQAEMPLDWFLFAKRAAEMNSARWEVMHSQAEFADLVRSRVTETATLFYNVLEAKALLSVAEQDLEFLTRIEQITQRAVEAEGAPPIELDRIRLELFRSRQELLEAESELNIAKAMLWAQFGRTDRDPNFTIRGNLGDPLTAMPYPLEEAFRLAQQNRPDIRALRLQVNRAQADTVVEKRNALPEVSLFGGYIREYQEVGREPGWGIGLSMTVPLFDRNQGGRAGAQAALARSSQELRMGMIDLRAEVEEADQLFRTAYRKAASLAQEELQLAMRVRDSIIRSYEIGGRPLIEVLDAERTVRETFRFYISSRADYWRAKYIYNGVIGR